MGILKKTIAFYCCTNGFGHYKRVNEVAKHLVDTHDITIYCSERQAKKIGKISNIKYEYYILDNIRWDLVTNGKSNDAIDQYFKWGEIYVKTVDKYDIVVSDNLPILLQKRSNVILMGSFLWKDVFEDYIGNNRLTQVDTLLLKKYSPVLITNKYMETQSVKDYNNKVQFGFGCSQQMLVVSQTKHTILQYPSLPYLNQYDTFLDTLNYNKELSCTKDLSYIYDTRIVARPGVGTITHCVEHSIPLIALYSENDSKEIKELAQIVEDLKIGYKQNIEEPLNMVNIKMLRSNTNFSYTEKFEKEGYKKTAEYLKKWIE